MRSIGRVAEIRPVLRSRRTRTMPVPNAFDDPPGYFQARQSSVSLGSRRTATNHTTQFEPGPAGAGLRAILDHPAEAPKGRTPHRTFRVCVQLSLFFREGDEKLGAIAGVKLGVRSHLRVTFIEQVGHRMGHQANVFAS